MLTHHQSARRRGPSLADRTDGASEQSLAAFWTAYVDAGRGGAPFILRNWPSSWAAVRAVRRLPVVEARPSVTPGGRAVRRVLATRASYGVPGRLLGTAILEVPEDGDEYVLGRRRPDVASQDPLGGAARAQGPPDRRGRRAARAGGGRQPRGAEPRRPVLPRADTAQRRPDRPRRLAHRRRPRGAAAAARGGAARRRVRDAALLPHPRASDAHSDARYLASSALVAELARHGVRYLLDTATPAEQTNGLRHFQRMVGFRYARVRLRLARRAARRSYA